MHLPQGISSTKCDILHSILVQLQNLLHFKTACEIQEVSGAQLAINVNTRPAGKHVHRYNSGLTEISVLVDEEPGPRDIVVHLRDVAYKLQLTHTDHMMLALCLAPWSDTQHGLNKTPYCNEILFISPSAVIHTL